MSWLERAATFGSHWSESRALEAVLCNCRASAASAMSKFDEDAENDDDGRLTRFEEDGCRARFDGAAVDGVFCHSIVGHRYLNHAPRKGLYGAYTGLPFSAVCSVT